MSAIRDVSTPGINAEETQLGIGQQPRALTVLTVITLLGIVIGLYLALFYAPTEVNQGHVQRIFYIHVSSFFGAFVAFGATVLGGVMYLRTRQLKWDTLALAGVEVGLVLSLVNLATGSIWARPIWNTWWTWDPRLTSAAIMALTYAAYLMLRNGIENPDVRRRFASVYGILAIITVIVTLVIIRVEPETLHPVTVGPGPQNAEGGFNMTGDMVVALLGNIAVWMTLVPVTLMWYRIRLENLNHRVNAMKLELMND